MNRSHRSSRPGAHEPRTDAAWLTSALREQADEHEADLTRIETGFDRLTAGESRRTEHRRPAQLLRLRLIGIPLGALAAVATATVAAGVTLGITARTTQVASQAAPSSSPLLTAHDRQPTPQPTPSVLRPAGTTSAHSESSPTARVGPLRATGTVDSHSTQYWAQEDLTITTTHAIHALHVVITVSGGSSAQSTGWWSTILSGNVDATASQIPGGLLYDITLKPGQTLQPGSYAFGFQFDHPTTGHKFSLDTYAVTATATDGAAQVSATGAFSN